MDSKNKDHTFQCHTFQLGVTAFNEGRYYDAHEEWEHIWLKEKGPEKPFYQGLIQVAAGFHHLQKNKLSPAKVCFKAGLLKLQPFQDCPLHFVDVEKLIIEIEKIVKDLEMGIIPPMVTLALSK